MHYLPLTRLHVPCTWQIVELEPSHVEGYRKQVPALCQLLKRLLQPGGAPSDYDISGTTNPFLQVKLLRLLRHLGECQSQDEWHVPCSEASAEQLGRPAGVFIAVPCSRRTEGSVCHPLVGRLQQPHSIGLHCICIFCDVQSRSTVCLWAG